MTSSGSRRQSDKAKAGKGPANRRSAAKKRGRRRSPKGRPPIADPSDTEDAEVRFVQPYQATRTYLCPGCNRDIPPGLGHMVAVPPDDPDLRRHWHRGCWNNRRNLR